MAVLGTGGLGVMLGKQVRRQPDADLTAIADVSDVSRAEAGDLLNVPPEARYDTLETLLDNESLDALVIATPHSLHYDQVRLALERNHHVLCEKPLATNVEDVRALDRYASDSDEVLMVGYQRHLEPEYQYARRRWADSDTEPDFISVQLTENWLSPNIDTWRTDPSLSGGGFLADTGDHIIDALLWMTGLTPTMISANMDFETKGIDTRANLTITFENGSHAHLSFHADVPRVTERFCGWDADGGIRIEGREWGDRSLTVVDGNGSEMDPYRAPRDSAYENPRTKLDGFIDAIDGTASVPATTMDALRAATITEAAYESARTAEPVSVEFP